MCKNMYILTSEKDVKIINTVRGRDETYPNDNNNNPKGIYQNLMTAISDNNFQNYKAKMDRTK